MSRNFEDIKGKREWSTDFNDFLFEGEKMHLGDESRENKKRIKKTEDRKQTKTNLAIESPRRQKQNNNETTNMINMCLVNNIEKFTGFRRD